MALRKKIRIGLVGAGGIALTSHLPWYRLHPGVRLAAVADTDEKKLRLARRAFGIPRGFSDASELFASGEVDAVDICTPPWCHEEQVAGAAAAGLHILCEKPLGLNAAQTRRMLKAVGEAGVILQVGFQKRFNPGFIKMREMIRDGRIGKVTGARVNWDFWYPDLGAPQFRRIVEAAGRLGVDLGREFGLWRASDARSGGWSLIDASIHYVDTLRYLMGEIAEVSCETRAVRTDAVNEDYSLLTLGFENGAMASIENNLNIVGRMMGDEGGTIQGTDGSLRFRVAPVNSLVPFSLEHYSYGNIASNRWTRVPMPPGTEILQYKHQIDRFIGAVAGRIPRHVRAAGPDTGADSLRAIRVIRAAYRAAGSGRKVKL
ncbi:MAG: Gfo/Idh/MocA family oxidoreductase [bacterium]